VKCTYLAEYAIGALSKDSGVSKRKVQKKKVVRGSYLRGSAVRKKALESPAFIASLASPRLESLGRSYDCHSGILRL
jgi:hypothetical protein